MRYNPDAIFELSRILKISTEEVIDLLEGAIRDGALQEMTVAEVKEIPSDVMNAFLEMKFKGFRVSKIFIDEAREWKIINIRTGEEAPRKIRMDYFYHGALPPGYKRIGTVERYHCFTIIPGIDRMSNPIFIAEELKKMGFGDAFAKSPYSVKVKRIEE